MDNRKTKLIFGSDLVLLLVIVIMLIICALITSAPVLADPDVSSLQAEADRIKSEIATINLTAEQAVERYNQASTELESTRQQMAQNEKALGEATQKLAEAQNRLEKRLQNIYREGSLSFMDVILNTSSFSEFMTRFDLLGRIGNQDKSDIDEVLKYKAEVERVQADLDSARYRQEELLETLAAEKSQVESQLAARQAVLSSVEGEVAQLLALQTQEEQAAAAPGPANSESSESPGIEPPGPGPAPEPPADDYPPPPPPANGGVVSIAMQYLGVPYIWGGASPRGFDCSGLVMYVYAQVGVYLPHSAAAQYYSGTPVSYSELAPGDLVFFGHPISHVGIYIGGGSMIHAPFEGTVVSVAGVGSGGSYAGACRL